MSACANGAGVAFGATKSSYPHARPARRESRAPTTRSPHPRRSCRPCARHSGASHRWHALASHSASTKGTRSAHRIPPAAAFYGGARRAAHRRGSVTARAPGSMPACLASTSRPARARHRPCRRTILPESPPSGDTCRCPGAPSTHRPRRRVPNSKFSVPAPASRARRTRMQSGWPRASVRSDAPVAAAACGMARRRASDIGTSRQTRTRPGCDACASTAHLATDAIASATMTASTGAPATGYVCTAGASATQGGMGSTARTQPGCATTGPLYRTTHSSSARGCVARSSQTCLHPSASTQGGYGGPSMSISYQHRSTAWPRRGWTGGGGRPPELVATLCITGAYTRRSRTSTRTSSTMTSHERCGRSGRRCFTCQYSSTSACRGALT